MTESSNAKLGDQFPVAYDPVLAAPQYTTARRPIVNGTTHTEGRLNLLRTIVQASYKTKHAV